MLEIKNLKKTYKAKGGVTVRALDDVSVVFPEKGMVFLLGKSGSGKSTLLNVTGGLDKPDSGEIIIKGKNSKDFSGADFDSYRNTFIGFIFQEYNILNEFNVEQNIALALQLQGKPNDKKAVEAILKQVDLEGYGRRKPNTLSGGQKQRIAIARALIKNPEIIMADEPTGALDSKTGKQVFDTLKKLSEEKLVIVVSHDRDFAEIYGDRIIELADGKIISDTTKTTVEPTAVSENIRIVNEHTIAIKDASTLKKSDAEDLLSLLKKQKGEVIISSGEHDLPLVKQAIHVRDDNRSEVFENTGEVPAKEYDPKNTKFIRSRLPMARAMKMGASSLKTKPVRMIFTIFLTVVSLTMFGAASTLMFYDPAYTIAEALRGSDNDYELISKSCDVKSVSRNYDTASDEITYESSYDTTRQTRFGVNEIASMNRNSVGHHFAGVVGSSQGMGGPLSFASVNATSDYFPSVNFTGLIEAGDSYMTSCGFRKLSGEYPDNKDEIAISKYMFDAMAASDETIHDVDDVVGKKVPFFLRAMKYSDTIDLTVTAIYDCGEIPARFATLKEKRDSKLSQSFESYLGKSYHRMAYVDPSFIDHHDLTATNSNYGVNIGLYAKNVMFTNWEIDEHQQDFYGTSFVPSDYLEQVQPIMKLFSFHDFEGNPIEYKTPGVKEVYVSEERYQEAVLQQKGVYFDAFNDFSNNYNNLMEFSEKAKAYFKNEANQKEIENLRWMKKDGKDNERVERIKVLLDELEFEKAEKRSYLFTFAQYVLNGRTNYYWSLPDEEARMALDTPEYLAFQDAFIRFDPNNSETESTDEDYQTLASYIKSEEGQTYLKYAIATSIVWGIRDDESIDSSLREQANTLTDGETHTLSEYLDFADSLIAAKIDPRRYGYLSFAYNEADALRDLNPPFDIHVYYGSSRSRGELKILGVFSVNEIRGYDYLMSKAAVYDCGGILEENAYVSYETSEYEAPSDARYDYAITPTQYSQAQISNLLQEGNHYQYSMTNESYLYLSALVSMISTMKTVFLIIGGVVAGFAALMLFNFISSSIAAKTKDIGILRAVGARGSDLFKIFFSESGIISLICVILSIIASIVTVNSINASMAQDTGVQMMQFGLLNAGLIVAGAIAIAIVGTFIPVFLASRKPPIESIRTL